MFILVTILHIIVCTILILVILLQAGRGGGLSEMFGGAISAQQKIFGTETNAFLVKATSYAAVLFIVTSITLSVITTSRSRSLFAGANIRADLEAPAKAESPAAPEAAAPAPETK